MSFNPNLCWYMDSTFCSNFHKAKAVLGQLTARILFVTIAFVLFTIALCGVSFNILLALKRANDALTSTEGLEGVRQLLPQEAGLEARLAHRRAAIDLHLAHLVYDARLPAHLLLSGLPTLLGVLRL